MKFELGNRRLIATGDGALTVTLPSIFTRAMHLRKGDNVEFYLVGGNKLLLACSRDIKAKEVKQK
jgi:antitoxin component of MazEF toxin-antitoxin module